jgi:hypothetical protein
MLKIFFWLLLTANVVLFGLNYGLWGAKAHESHEPERLAAQLHTEKLQLLSSSVDKVREVTPEQITLPTATTATTAAAEVSVPAAPAPAASVAKPEVAAPVTPPTPAPAPATVTAPPPVTTPAVAAPATTPAAPATPAPSAVGLMCFEFAYFNAADAQRFDTALAGLSLRSRPMQRSEEEIVSYMVHVPTSDGRNGADRKAAELRRQGVNDFYIMPGTYAIAALRWNISLGVFKTERAAKSFIAGLSNKGIKDLRIAPRKSGSPRQVYRLREVDRATQVRLERIMQNFDSQKMRNCE